MINRRQRIIIRNQTIRMEIDSLIARHPEWRLDAIISRIADDYFLSTRTVEAILKKEGVYQD